MRKRRLERLEKRQPSGPPYFDVYPLCMRLWAALQADHDAERAGREFCRLPSEPLSPEAESSPAMAEAMRYHDRQVALNRRSAPGRLNCGFLGIRAISAASDESASSF